MNPILVINSIRKVSSSTNHCAFTDLVRDPFHLDKLKFLCCYREATNHVSGDGVIRVHGFTHDAHENQDTVLSMKDTDLRDPKFVFNGAKLLITAFAKTRHTTRPFHRTSMVSFASINGVDWSGPVTFNMDKNWIWRTTWHDECAYGFAYNRTEEKLDLYSGDPSKKMTLLSEHCLSKEKHNAGYPNESHILFNDAQEAIALVRRDADSYSAKLGFSKPPYTDWHWKDLGIYIGGPVMTALEANFFLVAGRDWDEEDNDKLTTKVWLLDTKVLSLTELLTLPSAGDNSYPGLCIIKDKAYLSYYSSHEDDQTSVYFAEISGLNALLDVIKQT